MMAVNKLIEMQLTNLDMINNRIKTAKFKLNQHRTLGEKSTLSIYQVARLMDTVKRGDEINEAESQSIFFSWN
jgi:hypothetical protein